MGSRPFRYIAIFLLHLFLSSGSSLGETPPLEAIQDNQIVGNLETQILSSSPPATTTQLDAVPIVNPTNPGNSFPGVNPTDSPPVNPIESPPPPTTIMTNPPATVYPPVTVTPPVTVPPVTVNPPTTTAPTSSGGGSWCIASPTASQTALQVAIDYACGYGGADCSAIQPSGSCYNPNTLRDHASYAFNNYYQRSPNPMSCVFGGTAQLVTTDPSSGNCHFPSSMTTPSTTSPMNPTPPSPIPTTVTPMTPMTPMTPTTINSPVGVLEPVGEPSSATPVSSSLLLLFSVTTIVGSLAANHL